MTEEEEAGNVVGLCKGCIEDMIKQFNENLPQLKQGDFVKAMFQTGMDPEEGPSSESMWIEILSVEGDEVTGILSNIPSFISHTEMYYKQEVKVKLSQCWNYLEKK